MKKVWIGFSNENSLTTWLEDAEAQRFLDEFVMGRSRPRVGDFSGLDKNTDWRTDEVYEILPQRSVFLWDNVVHVQVTDSGE